MQTARDNTMLLTGAVGVLTPIPFLLPVMQEVPTTTKYVIAAFWLVSVALLLTVVKLAFDNHRVRRQVNHEITMSDDMWQAAEAAYELFCIVHTPDLDSVPDARYLRSWRDELFYVNGGRPSIILEKMKQGITPTLPRKDHERLNKIQHKALLELIGKYQQQPVR